MSQSRQNRSVLPFVINRGEITQDLLYRDSDSPIAEQAILRLIRAFVQVSSSKAELLRHPETVIAKPSAACESSEPPTMTLAPQLTALTVAPQPRPTAAAHQTCESRAPDCSPDDTRGGPNAQLQLSDDCQIYHSTSSTPTPVTAPQILQFLIPEWLKLLPYKRPS